MVVCCSYIICNLEKMQQVRNNFGKMLTLQII